MIRIVDSLRLALVFLIASAVPIRAQVRPGLAHEIEASARGGDPYETATIATHDPDSDGALIGAAVGAAGLGTFWGVRSEGYLAPLGAMAGVLVGGFAGLVMGAAIDAADPFASSGDASIPAPPAVPDTLAMADTTAVGAARGTPRSPPSRRNDFVGAVIGAAVGDLLAAGVCSGLSEGGSCGFFRLAYLPVIGIGALLGAGIGSAVGEQPGGTP